MNKEYDCFIGNKYGSLTILEIKREWDKNRNNMFTYCVCDCGKKMRIRFRSLVTGNTKSCGCLDFHTTHGMSKHPLYYIHDSMIARCYRPKSGAYKNYGGRGIYVCKEWLKRENFFRWAKENGWRRDLEIDRIDNDGPYSPKNCRFVTRKESVRNRRNTCMIVYNGSLTPLSEVAENIGINYRTLWHRIFIRGWTAEEAISSPLGTRIK